MSMPDVSIVINNYNYGRYVGQAIESALAQTHASVEVIVVDDGSTDQSQEIIKSFGTRIKALQQANGGQTSAMNLGLSASSADWVCLLDADDIFLPTKVSRILQLAAENPTAGMIAHDLQYCGESGQPIDYAKPYIPAEKLVDDRSLVARRGSLSVSLPATSGLCIRRDVLGKLLPMPSEMRVGTDNYMKWIILSLVPVLLSPELLTKQRIHSRNLMTTVVEGGGKEARVLFAMNSAIITYHMKMQHRQLKKLAWKQYGRLLYGLRSAKSEQSLAIEKKIRQHYSVVELNPVCIFLVGAAFAKAYAEDLLQALKNKAGA